ncbi:MAG: hypothetical protein M1530_02985 [Candidatus Marsarchaeota archaeon]|nr:hypothetical protein [Candidatus Marsarchaeota archaeon]
MRGVGTSIILILLLAVPLFSQSAGQCFPNAAPTYLRLSVDDTGTRATLNAYLYALNLTSAQRQAIPISGGLLFVSWADFPAGACYMVTGGDGTVNATFGPNPPNSNYPSGGQSLTYTVTFCPFTANNSDLFAINPQWLANCARFRDPSQSPPAVTRLTNFQNQLSRCPSSQANSVAGSSQIDLSPSYQPSTSFLTLRNSSPSQGSVAFCWGLAAVFGLLFSAMFVSGRNPLYFFDFAATRGLRINRYSGYYMPMTQNVTMAPLAVLSAAGRVASMAGLGSEESESQSDVVGADKELKNAKTEDSKVQSSNAPQSMKDASTQKVAVAEKKLAVANAKLDAAKALVSARKDGDKTKIAEAEKNYQTVTTAFNKVSAESDAINKVPGSAPRSTEVGFNRRMQQASGQDAASGWLGRQLNFGLGVINPLKSANLVGTPDKEGNRGFWANLANGAIDTVSEGMVRGVVMSIPGMAMGRGKFGLKKVGTEMGESLKRQARATAKGELISLVKAGTMAVAPLLVHGIPNTPDAKEWENVIATSDNKELKDAKKNLDEKEKESMLGPLFGPAPDYKKREAELKAAKERYASAQENLLNEARSNASSSISGIVSNVMGPTFELLVDRWLGSEQPPRLSAMYGAGGAIGLTLSDYLTSPVKAMSAQDYMQLQNAITRSLAH